MIDLQLSSQNISFLPRRARAFPQGCCPCPAWRRDAQLLPATQRWEILVLNMPNYICVYIYICMYCILCLGSGASIFFDVGKSTRVTSNAFLSDSAQSRPAQGPQHPPWPADVPTHAHAPTKHRNALSPAGDTGVLLSYGRHRLTSFNS